MSKFSFTVSPEAVASIHEDGIVVLNTGTGCLYASNGSGARIWRGVEQQLPLEVIAEEISNEYHIADLAAREHVINFLAELERHALIQKKGEL